jgi:sialic acid synthase SpsE
LEEVDASVNFLKRRGASLALMHCVSKYPCPTAELNLRTVEFFKQRYNIPVGFSDHSIGVDSALASVALGATIIEKHFSLSRDLWGSDHKVAMTPAELSELVRGIRELEINPVKKEEYLNKEVVKAGLGQADKILQSGEEQFRPFFRKTLAAACDIKKGEVINSEKLWAMRPQAYLAGLPSEKYEEILGQKAPVDLKKGDPIPVEFIS